MNNKVWIFLLAALLISSCANDVDTVSVRADAIAEIGFMPSEVVHPQMNPNTQDKVELGRTLFWDPILSGNKDIACASCHHPQDAYADGIERSLGVGGQGLGTGREGGVLIDRNSPSILNTAFNGITLEENYLPDNAPMFWDNRESSLEKQAIQPILSAEEMRGDQYSEDEIMDVVIERLTANEEYVALFENAFGSSNITSAQIGEAIASFERSLIAYNSPFDRFINGDDQALTNEELRGLEQFLDVGCANCHNGPMFSDFELHTLGVKNNGIDDRGATDVYDFRTPSLRNVELTAPYMHNGIFNNLEDAVEFYEDITDGERDELNDNVRLNDIAEDARELDADEGDVDDIVAFLKSLTDTNFDKSIPTSVPSNLPVGGNID